MEVTNEELVKKANLGDKKALEDLLIQIRDGIYSLALRMLYEPTDAEDATQEILIRIITHLGTFKGNSSFKTWMYRVACNHLLTMRKRKAERNSVSFEQYETSIDHFCYNLWNYSRM